MKYFEDLVKLAEKLLGPDGCPWDKEQTLFSLKKYLLEEAKEVIQAIECKDWENLKEELGDVLFNIIFMAKLAHNNKKFNIYDVIEDIYNKIVRRHPHIFGKMKLENSEQVKKVWKDMKILEKEKKAGD